jgi:hypothetical protein
LRDNSKGYQWDEDTYDVGCKFTGGAYHVSATQDVRAVQDGDDKYTTCIANHASLGGTYQVDMTIIKGKGGGIIYSWEPSKTDQRFVNLSVFTIDIRGNYSIWTEAPTYGVSFEKSGSSPAVNVKRIVAHPHIK